jgi:hypothetical protein
MTELYYHIRDYTQSLPDKGIEFRNLHIDHNCVLSVPDFDKADEQRADELKDRHKESCA